MKHGSRPMPAAARVASTWTKTLVDVTDSRMAGAKLVANYPVSVITDGMGLNITVMSYMGHMDFGIIADRDQMPDLDVLMEHLREELEALKAEHRQLDDEIAILAADPASDQLEIARLKRRKLRLKDQIQLISDSNIPDIIA